MAVHSVEIGSAFAKRDASASGPLPRFARLEPLDPHMGCAARQGTNPHRRVMQIDRLAVSQPMIGTGRSIKISSGLMRQRSAMASTPVATAASKAVP
jgi:hypothetical protein